MTPRQHDCYTAIKDYWASNGYGPSYSEIQTALGAKSKASVQFLISKLEERGYVERIPNLARSIRITSAEQPPANAE